MRISVVINTFNRATSLAATLRALQLQTHRDFEVVVVDGPSTDGTQDVLAAYGSRIRTERIEARNLSVSRNRGIDLAAGELVAFIDDDAIPFPTWLEELEAPFQDPAVVGTGGLVYRPDGRRLQYRYSVCDRVGRTTFGEDAPGPEATLPDADPFIYLQGTNMCFRRSALVAVDGFDEEIEYNYDEVELCVRLIDAGGRLVPLDGAGVIHNYLQSHLRDESSEVTNPFPAIKNRYYFAFKTGLGTGRTVGEIGQIVEDYVSEIMTYQDRRVRAGLLVPTEYERLTELAARAADVGLAAGLRGRNDGRHIAPREDAAFVPLDHRTTADRRRIVFVSHEYPPASMGGIGRFTNDLARGFAAHGHEVHVVTSTHGTDPVLELREDVWVHEIAPGPAIGALAGRPAADLLGRSFAVATSVDEIERDFGPIALVSAPLWSAEGLVVSLDPGRPVVTTLMTTMRTISAMHADWDPAAMADHLALETAALRSSKHLHAISKAIMEDVDEHWGEVVRDVPRTIAPLGVADQRGRTRRTRPHGGPVRILFVGRLEHRKGVDLLLEAAHRLDAEGLDFELVLVGKDTPNTELPTTYREAFEADGGATDGLRDRVVFAGEVDEDGLYAAYAEADVFCGPSRYESLGLTHLEAGMMGLPVVGCAVGGLRETVDDGVTGLLVPPDDATALTDALRSLVLDADLRERLGAAGREAFDDRWNLDVAVRRTLDAYLALDVAPIEAGERRAGWDAALVSGLSDALDLPEADAASVVRQGFGHRDDGVPSSISRSWNQDVATLIRAAFHALLSRPASPGEVRAWSEKIHTGLTPQGEVLNDIADSDEAADVGPRAPWLAALHGYPGWSTADALASAFRQPSHERWATELAELWLGPASQPEERRALRGEVLDAAVMSAGDRHEALERLEATGTLGRREDGTTIAAWTREALAESERAEIATDHAAPAGPGARGLRTRVREATGAGPTLYRRIGGISAAVGRMETAVAEHDGVPTAVARIETNTDGVPHALGSVRNTLDDLSWGVRETVRRLAASHAEQTAIARQAAEDLTTVLATMNVLHAKHVALAMEVRELQTSGRAGELVRETKVLDPSALEARPLRINVGCGEKPEDGYVNVDARPLPGVAVVAEAGDLPLADASVDEISSSHLVEHFREHALRRRILPHWLEKLVPGGRLRIICPDWEHMIERRQRGEMSWADFKTVTFGQQDYEGDDHFAMYSAETLSAVVADAGFVDCEMVATGRRNGLSSEMELVARRPVG